MKIGFSGLAENAFLDTCFHANIVSNEAVVLKGHKILFQSFLVRSGEKVLEFYLLLIGLFFLKGKDKQKSLSTVYFPPNSYFNLKSIVLNHI